jgi:Ca2+-transporting ATPase
MPTEETTQESQQNAEGQTPNKQPEQPWHTMPADDVLSDFESSQDGLSEDEAQSRLDEYGPNQIGEEEEISKWQVLLNQFTSPLIYVLLGALVVTLAIQKWSDAIVIGLVLVINASVGFYQEYRAETAVRSLMEMVAPKANVKRGGEEKEVESDKLVPGDVVMLGEGEMVPADMRLIKTKRLQVNEAALTGESVPASKSTDPLEDADEDTPPADQSNLAFMGTAVTSGRGLGVIVATGTKTQIGDIAEQVRTAGDTKSPLQERMDRLAKGIAVLILVVCAIAIGVGLLMGRTLQEMFLLGVALAVAAMPAGLPVVTTVALAIGVGRMAERQAIIRHLPAVETLGSTTAILSDKTGTLTQNRMTVQQVVVDHDRYEIKHDDESGLYREDEKQEVEEESALFYTLLSGALNNNASLKSEGEGEEDEEESGPSGDPMEVALLESARSSGLDLDELAEKYEQVEEVPFETERKFSATIHEVDGEKLVLVKGAPEVILEMSDDRTVGTETESLDEDEIKERMEELATQGLRVLAMAIGKGDEAAESIESDDPSGMTFVGMQGVMDPPREEAVKAIDNCHRAGIRVMMITGDHARTAAAIAHQVHLDEPAQTHEYRKEHDEVKVLREADQEAEEEPRHEEETEEGSTWIDPEDLPEVHTGREVGDASDEDLDDMLSRTNVYARVAPDQKLRLVKRLKENGEIVAVTGDGVNDAPALKEGDLGAAMGKTGTDVAKEASDMVITDDNFASVYAAVEEGRTSFRNIRMATFFLLSTGGADVLIILASLALQWPLPLLPAQLLWCNVVTNGIQDVALAFEPGEKALTQRPPRPPEEGILDKVLIERLVFVGIWLAAGTIGIFYWKYSGDESLTYARTAALTTLVLFQMFHVFNCRSEDVSIFKKNLFSNRVLFIGVIISLAVHIGALYLPWTQNLLRVTPLDGMTWLVIVGVAATAIVVNELHKWLRPRKA